MRTPLLIELIVVSIIIGVISAVSIPRFIGAKDRAKIAAAESEVTRMRQALVLYVGEWSTYVTSAGDSSMDYNKWKESVIDREGNAYVVLPDTFNFVPATFSIKASNNTFTIAVEARDSKNTIVNGNSEKTWYHNKGQP